ncbi:MAG: hypothetical protein WC717_02580 [Candidatus Micrarchaeia archaeon]|jgi:hypothetical protein
MAFFSGTAGGARTYSGNGTFGLDANALINETFGTQRNAMKLFFPQPPRMAINARVKTLPGAFSINNSKKSRKFAELLLDPPRDRVLVATLQDYDYYGGEEQRRSLREYPAVIYKAGNDVYFMVFSEKNDMYSFLQAPLANGRGSAYTLITPRNLTQNEASDIAVRRWWGGLELRTSLENRFGTALFIKAKGEPIWISTSVFSENRDLQEGSKDIINAVLDKSIKVLDRWFADRGMVPPWRVAD